MAHNNYSDQKRRHINFREMQVENILPEHFGSLYPKFIALLESYYDFQSENKSTELLSHLFAARDINETDISLLTFIEDELLLGEEYFKGFGKNETELRAAANFSNILFRSKGTKFAIEWFFRSFYGEDVEVLYPKDSIFKVSDIESQLGPDSLRYLTDDKLYQTFAILVRVGIPISKWKEVFKLFVHPAGMYLGGEVFIQDDVNPNIVTLNDVVNQYASPSYVLASATTIDEGNTLTIFANGSNVPNSIDAIYWYGEHIDTVDSDFGINSFDGTFGLPDSDNAQYLAINGSTGSFNISTIVDPKTNPAESDEDFKIYIIDRAGRPLANTTITLGDVVPGYTFALPSDPIADTMKEGNGPYSINISGTNIPNGGNTTLRWYIEPTASSATLKDSDFIDFYAGASTFPIDIATSKEIVVSSSTGSFILDPRVDGISDGTESVAIKIVNPNDNEVGNFTIDIQNVATDMGVTVNDIVEGNSLQVTVTSGAYNVGKSFSWEITGNLASDARISTTEGTGVFQSDGVGGAINSIIVATTVSAASQGPTTGTFTVQDTNLNAAIPNAYAQGSASDTFTMTDAAAAYTITASPAAATEGDTVSYIIGGTNIPDGTAYFGIANITTDAGDWTTTPPDIDSRQAITISGGTGSFSLTYASNGDTDDETYQINAYTDGPSNIGQSVASEVITLLGSGNITTVTPSTLAPNENTGANGFSMTAAVATNQPDGTYKYWITGQVNSDDFLSGYQSIGSKGDVVISSGTGTINLTIKDDFRREGTEIFGITVGSSVSPNSAIASSASISVADTSKQTYFINNYTTSAGGSVATTVIEANNLNIGITGDAVEGVTETLYVELSGTGASQYTDNTKVITGPGTTGQRVTSSFVTNGDNSVFDGARTVTVRVTTGNYFSTGLHTALLETLTLTLNDGPATSTLIAVDTTPQEGDNVVFNSVTTNIGNGTDLYYMPSSAVAFTGSQTSGQSVITATSSVVSSLSNGMRGVYYDTGSLTEMGTITSLSGSSIFMTTTSNSSGSSNFIFMQDDDWDDYQTYGDAYGSYTINSNAGTFTIDTGEDTSINDKAITIRVADTAFSATNILATEVITIQNTTVNPIEYTQIDPHPDSGIDNYSPQLSAAIRYEFYSISQPNNPTTATVVSEVQFRTNGDIYSRGINDDIPGASSESGPNSSVLRKVGTWGTGSITGGNYDIRVTNPNPSATFSGSTGAWLNLSSNRTWTFSYTLNNEPGGASGAASNALNVEIRAANTGENADLSEYTWTLSCAITFDDIGGLEGSG